jgi:hypothetical protein
VGTVGISGKVRRTLIGQLGYLPAEADAMDPQVGSVTYGYRTRIRYETSSIPSTSSILPVCSSPNSRLPHYITTCIFRSPLWW